MAGTERGKENLRNHRGGVINTKKEGKLRKRMEAPRMVFGRHLEGRGKVLEKKFAGKGAPEEKKKKLR